MSIFGTEFLTSKEISAFFDELPAQSIEPLHVFEGVDSSGNHRYLTVHKMFECHFRDCVSRFKKTESEMALVMFKTIFYDNRWLVAKIGKEVEVLQELCDFKLYHHEVKYTSNDTHDSNNTSTFNQDQIITDERNMIDGNLVGTSDAATMGTIRDKTLKAIEARKVIEKSENKILDYMDPNVKTLTQNITVYGGTNKNTLALNTRSTNTTGIRNNANSSTISSNPQEDRITFLKTELPKLRCEFFNLFRAMFYV